MVRNMNYRILPVVGLVAALSCSEAVAFHATKPIPRVTVTGRVLLGSAKYFHSVGTLDRRRVFHAAPAAQTIRRERVPRDSARYHFLVVEANRAVGRALEEVALRAGVDFVVEQGGVEVAGVDVIDLTDLTLAYLVASQRAKARS